MTDLVPLMKAVFKEYSTFSVLVLYAATALVVWSGVNMFKAFERWRFFPARRADPRWTGACSRAGLEDVHISKTSVTGRTEALSIRVGGVVQDGRLADSWGLEIAVSCDRRTPGFNLRSANRAGRGGLRMDDTHTGDEVFDRRFEIEGAVATVLATLDAETRRLLLQQDAYGGLDLQGRTAITLCSGAPNLLEIEDALTHAMALSEHLSRPIDVRTSLGERATSDPVAGVRAEAVRALGRAYPGDPATLAAARTALGDADHDVRIKAAIVLGDQGVATLEALLAEPGLRDASVATLITALDQRLTASRAAEVLADARDRRRHHTAVACIQRLAKGPQEEALGPLVKVLRADDFELACAAARALGALGSEAAESSLVSALGRDSPALRVDAAQALGRSGTVSSVIRLKEAAERHAADGQFPLIARRAIAGIQARAAGADHGQLSVADDQAGQLSLAEREAGRVSMTPGGAGRLSVPEDEAGRLSPVRTRAGSGT